MDKEAERLAALRRPLTDEELADIKRAHTSVVVTCPNKNGERQTVCCTCGGPAPCPTRRLAVQEIARRLKDGGPPDVLHEPYFDPELHT